MGRIWIIGLLVLGGAIFLTSSNFAGYWLPLALVIVAGAVWVIRDRVSDSQSGRSGTTSTPSSSKEDALETLKQQYAAGEIDDEEFERRLETLLENETIADVENRIDVDSDVTRETTGDDPEPERRSSPQSRNRRHGGKHRHCRH